MSKSPWDDEIENIFTRKRNKLNFSGFNGFNFASFNNGKVFLFLLLGIFLLWLASGIYKLKEGEQAVILRFGNFNRITLPGLNYHLPSPIEERIIERVNTSRTTEVGYRSASKYGSQASQVEIANESTMLTGDENIVNLSTQITWHIESLPDYVLNIKNPENTVKDVAQSVIREVIAEKPISSILSDKKQLIADQIEANMQNTLDKYGAGIKIEKVNLLEAQAPVQVRPAFIDVKTASADKQREINQAYAYRNNILPEARGECAKLTQEAEAYRQEVIERSKGDAKSFSDLLIQYTNNKEINKEIMKQRIYLETVEKVLQNSKKIVIGNEVLSHMSLNELLNKN
jgi:membrane protease subunit HflK